MWREEQFQNFDGFSAEAGQKFWEELNRIPEEVIKMAEKKDWQAAKREFLVWVKELVIKATTHRYERKDLAKKLYQRADSLERWRERVVKPAYEEAKIKWENFKEKASCFKWGMDYYRKRKRELWNEYHLSGELSSKLRKRINGLRKAAGKLWQEYKELPLKTEKLLKEMGVKVYKTPKGLQVEITDFRKALPWIATFKNVTEVRHLNAATEYYNELNSF